MSILLPIYEFVFVPLIRKITHHPSGITQLQRVGVGLVLSSISMAVAGFVEVKRKKQAIRDPTKPISLFWLSFQYGIFGIADMFTLVGLLEFFYKEAPAGMRSLSTSLTWLSLSLGYFLSTVLVDVINAVTKRNGEQGWIYGLDLNKNHLNLFYCFLAILSCLNFLNYLFWAYWYKYKSQLPHSNNHELASSSDKTEDAKEKEACCWSPSTYSIVNNSLLPAGQGRLLSGTRQWDWFSIILLIKVCFVLSIWALEQAFRDIRL